LKEYIAPGTTQGDFIRRVSASLGVTPDATASSQEASVPESPSLQPAAQPVSTPVESGANITAPDTTTAVQTSSGDAPVAPSAPAPRPRNSRQASAPTRNNSQRDAVLEAVQRRLQDSQAKGKEKATAEPEEAEDSAQAESRRRHQEETRKHSEAIKKKQLEARQERERILKRIEDDKRSRRKREEYLSEEKKLAEERGEAKKESEAETAQGMASSLVTGKKSTMTALQVRLFDGATIRTRLPSSATVRDGVRPWVDSSSSDSKTPYTFRVVLTPLPNKAIDATEEDKSLRELGLTPSATLVMIPVEKYSSAYESTAPSAAGNVFSGILGAIMGFFAWLLGLISGVFSGLGSRAPAEEPAPSAEEIRARREQRNEATRIRGFQNPADQRDYQLYNGNSVSARARLSQTQDRYLTVAVEL